MFIEVSNLEVLIVHNTIKAYIYEGEKYWVAQCIEIDVVTQGKTIEEAIKNLKEAVYLHLEGEDLSEFNLLFITPCIIEIGEKVETQDLERLKSVEEELRDIGR